jgi:hypothetical protein
MAHDDGGDVGNPMDEPAAIGQDQQPDTSTPGQGKGVLEDSGSAKTQDQTPDQSTDAGQQDQTIVLPGNALSAVLAKLPYDAVMDKGVGNILNQYAATQNEVQQEKDFPQLDPTAPQDITTLPRNATPQQIQAFNRSNGGVSPGGNQGAYGQFAADENGDVPGVRVVEGGRAVPQGTAEGRAQKNAIELQQEKNKGLEAVGGLRAGATEGAAQIRATTSSQNNQRTVAGRLQQEIIRATGGELNAGGAMMVKRANALTAAGITDPKQIAQALAPFAAQANISYQTLQRVIQNATAGQAPAQGGEPAGTGPEPVPPVEQRQIGKTYMTPKGPAVWQAQGWQVGQ